jgi:hypothetical protein
MAFQTNYFPLFSCPNILLSNALMIAGGCRCIKNTPSVARSVRVNLWPFDPCFDGISTADD